jgi:hypothetical protein
MSFFTTVKNAGIKAKLQGEIALLDRQVLTRQQAFGVELYDLLHRLEKSSNSVVNPVFLGTQSQSIKQVFDTTQLTIREWAAKKDAKADQVEHLQVDRERARPVTTASEQWKRAGQWVSSNSAEAKLTAEMAYLDRQIRLQKEAFGVQVFELVTPSAGTVSSTTTTTTSATPNKGLIGAAKSGLTNQLSKLSSQEKEIQKCIDVAKGDVERLEASKSRKRKEIERLE